MQPTIQASSSPPMGVALERTIDLAQRLASDELRLVQLDSHGRVGDALGRGAWIGFGALCLGIAWVAAWAAVLVALEGRFSLEARLAMLAVSQLMLGAALVRFGLRRQAAAA